MSTQSSVSRRTLLAAGAGGVGATLVAACNSSGSSTPKADAGTKSKAGGSAAATTTSPAALATLADIKVGSAVAVNLPDGKPGIVARPTATTAACFSAICTHMGCTVAPAGTTLLCPCHGSKFDAMTGARLSGLAQQPLPTIAVTVVGGKVLPA